MKWQEVMTFLSGLGMGAMLVQKNGIIAAINEVGKSFLAMSKGLVRLCPIMHGLFCFP